MLAETYLYAIKILLVVALVIFLVGILTDFMRAKVKVMYRSNEKPEKEAARMGAEAFFFVFQIVATLALGAYLISKLWFF